MEKGRRRRRRGGKVSDGGVTIPENTDRRKLVEESNKLLNAFRDRPIPPVTDYAFEADMWDTKDKAEQKNNDPQKVETETLEIVRFSDNLESKICLGIAKHFWGITNPEEAREVCADVLKDIRAELHKHDFVNSKEVEKVAHSNDKSNDWQITEKELDGMVNRIHEHTRGYFHSNEAYHRASEIERQKAMEAYHRHTWAAGREGVGLRQQLNSD